MADNLKIFFQDPAPTIKLYAKIVEFQTLQSTIMQDKLNQQVNLYHHFVLELNTKFDSSFHLQAQRQNERDPTSQSAKLGSRT